MNHRTTNMVFGLIFASSLLLAGCAGTIPAGTTAVTVRQSPVPTAANKAKTEETFLASTAPITATASPASVAASPTTANGNDALAPDVQKFLLSYNYDQVQQYNIYFEEKTAADMNGDDKDEPILLQGQKTETMGQYRYYANLNIKIGGQQLTLAADPGWSFGAEDATISGTVLDIDKSDRKKELLVQEQNSSGDSNLEQQVKYILINYRDNKPRELLRSDNFIEANGTGYIVGIQSSKELKGGFSILYYDFERYNPQKGFEAIKSTSYKTLSYTDALDQSSEGFPTMWDQPLAASPGKPPEKLIKKGTKISFGTYDTNGWMEITTVDRKVLGWLDLNQVDVDQYINNALQATCH